MILQTLIVKTVLEAVKRAFWKNGNPAAGTVTDILTVKHYTADPAIDDHVARALAWLLRGLVIIALVKVAQIAGFDITPYLHMILQTATETATETAGG